MTATALRLALIGMPIATSLSPLMHRAAAERRGIPLSYELFPLGQGRAAAGIAELQRQGFAGLNVTAPLKQEALVSCTELSPLASLCGAINTISFANGAASGHNTDIAGFAALLEHCRFEAAGQTCVVLGAGGAARAVTLALAAAEASGITVLARRCSSLSSLSELASSNRAIRLAQLDSDEASCALAAAELIVNASSAGMSGSEQDSPLHGFPPVRRGALALDLVYSPPRTRFMCQMANLGLRTDSGLPMLAGQAAASFSLWTGGDVSAGEMLQHLREAGHGA